MTAETLLRVTREALDNGIAQVRVGARISDIGHAIQKHVEAHGFSVVREFVGHGIGASLHEEPQIANYGEPGRGPRLAEGMTLAIEPMVNMGKPAVKVLADGWTAVTKDGSLSAHFEHTVAVGKNGPDILTARHAGRPVSGGGEGHEAADDRCRRGQGIAALRAVSGGDRRAAADYGARAEWPWEELHPRAGRRSGSLGAEPAGRDARKNRSEAVGRVFRPGGKDRS